MVAAVAVAAVAIAVAEQPAARAGSEEDRRQRGRAKHPFPHDPPSLSPAGRISARSERRQPQSEVGSRGSLIRSERSASKGGIPRKLAVLTVTLPIWQSVMRSTSLYFAILGSGASNRHFARRQRLLP